MGQEKDVDVAKDLAGKTKAFMTVLSKAEYGEIRGLGIEYRARNPRSVLR